MARLFERLKIEVPASRLSARQKHKQLVPVITCSVSLPSFNAILEHTCRYPPVFLFDRHAHTRARTPSVHHLPPCLQDPGAPLEDNEG